MLLVEQQSPCPECGGKAEVDYARGETVCAECGLVVQDRLIDGSPDSCEGDTGLGVARGQYA